MKVVLALLVVSAFPVAAQLPGSEPNPATQYSALRGVAVDSLRGGLLKGASLGIVGTSRMGLTDSLGRFFIDSVPPGEHTIALFDHLLDLLSISVISPPTRFTAAETVEVVIAIPSQQTILTAKCGAVSDSFPSALFGTVRRAVDNSQVEGAAVRLAWLDVTIDKTIGVRTQPQQRVAQSDSHGRYMICALPTGLDAELLAVHGADSTSAVPIAYGEAQVGLANLFLPGPKGAPSVADDQTHIQGRVLDGEGRAVNNALVSVSSAPAAVSTGVDGGFTIDARRLGTHTLLIRRLGYQPVEVVVDVLPGVSPSLTVSLDQFVPILESVVIRARLAAALEEVGFARRKRYGLGRYWERAELRDISSLDHFMQTIPVLRRQNDLPRVTISASSAVTSPVGRGTGAAGRAASRTPRTVPAQSNRCPRTFVDGVEIPKGVSSFVMPNELAAIEVYSAVMTPAEFRGFENCPTIVIWTDRRLRRGF